MNERLHVVICGRGNYDPIRRRAEKLIEQGCKVDIITIHPKTIEHLNIINISPRIGTFLRYLVCIPKLIACISKLDPDVIDFHGASTYGLWSLAIKRYKKVVTIYGPDIYMQPKKNRVLRALVKRVLRSADVVYGSTPALEDYIKSILKMNPSEYNGQWRSWGIPIQEKLGLVKRHTFEKPSEMIVVHSRRFMPFWNIKQLVEAQIKVLNKGHMITCVYMFPNLTSTEKDYFEQINALVSNARLEKHFKFLGEKSYTSYLETLASAKVYVCVGKDDLLAATLLEAMLFGCIPVLSKLKAYEEVVEHDVNGYYVENLEDALVKSIEHAISLSDSEMRQISETNGSLIIEKYSEQICTQWMIDLYKNTVGTK